MGSSRVLRKSWWENCFSIPCPTLVLWSALKEGSFSAFSSLLVRTKYGALKVVSDRVSEWLGRWNDIACVLLWSRSMNKVQVQQPQCLGNMLPKAYGRSEDHILGDQWSSISGLDVTLWTTKSLFRPQGHGLYVHYPLGLRIFIVARPWDHIAFALHSSVTQI